MAGCISARSSLPTLPFRVWDMDDAGTDAFDVVATGAYYAITKLQTAYGTAPFQQLKALNLKVTPR